MFKQFWLPIVIEGPRNAQTIFMFVEIFAILKHLPWNDEIIMVLWPRNKFDQGSMFGLLLSASICRHSDFAFFIMSCRIPGRQPASQPASQPVYDPWQYHPTYSQVRDLAPEGEPLLIR